jgi:predicted GNAT superfamily acetyltransferase
MSVQVRDWQAGDLALLHAINEGAVPGVGTLTRTALDDLIRRQSAATLIASGDDGQVLGFVLVMHEGLDYASLNYKWLSERYERFAYVDRIVVDAAARGQRIGEALYEAVVARFAGLRQVLLAEVNLAPPNPGSLRFHKRHGFVEAGERWEDDRSKGVVYLARDLRGASG